MKREVRILGVKRKEIDEEKLALAFLLLAKCLDDQVENEDAGPATDVVDEAA